MKKRKSPKGFSLLEVMVALSVVAIGLAAVYSLFTQSVSASQTARFRREASALAEEKLATWLSAPEEVASDAGDFGGEHAGWSWKLEVFPVKNKDHEELAKRLKKLRLEVFKSEEPGRYAVVHYLKVKPQ